MDTISMIKGAQYGRIVSLTEDGVAFYDELYNYYSDIPGVERDLGYEHKIYHLGNLFYKNRYDDMMQNILRAKRDDLIRLAKVIKCAVIWEVSGLLAGFHYISVLLRLCMEYKDYIVPNDLVENLLEFISINMERTGDLGDPYEIVTRFSHDYIVSDMAANDFYEQTKVMYNADRNTEYLIKEWSDMPEVITSMVHWLPKEMLEDTLRFFWYDGFRLEDYPSDDVTDSTTHSSEIGVVEDHI